MISSPLEISTSTVIEYNKFRRFFCSRTLAMAGVPFVTAAVFLWAVSRSNTIVQRTHQRTYCSSAIGTSTGGYDTNISNNNNNSNIRTHQTPADLYFRKHKKIPHPKHIHTTLPNLIAETQTHADNEINEHNVDCIPTPKRNILVIGDVHGCYEELLELHSKAEDENGGPFAHVILVGDLCNKGPYSAKVIRHVRTTPDWYTVRGNHDDGALAAALGDETKRKKKKYDWIYQQSEQQNVNNKADDVILSDEDIQWISNLPYTITIPQEHLGEEEDTIVVHAGFVPEMEIQEQEIDTMITVRDLKAKCDDNGRFTHYKPHEKSKKVAKVAQNIKDAKTCDDRVTWASAWFGPKRVIFGHNAKRRLQMYPGNYAIGLDTGAVYGGELTGIILPERKLVSIETKVHTAVDTKNDDNS